MTSISTKYTYTNEVLRSIISGMNPTKDDKLLCILGSGDQVIALSSFTKNIVALDVDDRQFSVFQEKAKLFSGSLFEEYVKNMKITNLSNYKRLDNSVLSSLSKCYEKNNTFFQTLFNTNKLSLDSISLVVADLLSYIREKGHEFNKIYFSNVHECIGVKRFKEELTQLYKYVKPGTLLYFCSDPVKLVSDKHLFDWMKLDEKLTSLARKHEELWSPAIYIVTHASTHQ